MHSCTAEALTWLCQSVAIAYKEIKLQERRSDGCCVLTRSTFECYRLPSLMLAPYRRERYPAIPVVGIAMFGDA